MDKAHAYKSTGDVLHSAFCHSNDDELGNHEIHTELADLISDLVYDFKHENTDQFNLNSKKFFSFVSSQPLKPVHLLYCLEILDICESVVRNYSKNPMNIGIMYIIQALSQASVSQFLDAFSTSSILEKITDMLESNDFEVLTGAILCIKCFIQVYGCARLPIPCDISFYFIFQLSRDADTNPDGMRLFVAIFGLISTLLMYYPTHDDSGELSELGLQLLQTSLLVKRYCMPVTLLFRGIKKVICCTDTQASQTIIASESAFLFISTFISPPDDILRVLGFRAAEYRNEGLSLILAWLKASEDHRMSLIQNLSFNSLIDMLHLSTSEISCEAIEILTMGVSTRSWLRQLLLESQNKSRIKDLMREGKYMIKISMLKLFREMLLRGNSQELIDLVVSDTTLETIDYVLEEQIPEDDFFCLQLFGLIMELPEIASLTVLSDYLSTSGILDRVCHLSESANDARVRLEATLFIEKHINL